MGQIMHKGNHFIRIGEFFAALFSYIQKCLKENTIRQIFAYRHFSGFVGEKTLLSPLFVGDIDFFVYFCNIK